MTRETKVTDGVAVHSSIYAALAAAQLEMGPALKSSENPHFRSKYADLGAVMDACLPALNRNGIAVFQPLHDEDGNRYVKTVLAHTSGETLECRVPLIVSKNDMQGYGSAVTYARRYGLMSMAGIAPEDDDGNAAAKAAPREMKSAFDAKAASQRITRKLETAESLDDLADRWRSEGDTIRQIKDANADLFDELTRTKDARKATLEANPPVEDDEIPY